MVNAEDEEFSLLVDSLGDLDIQVSARSERVSSGMSYGLVFRRDGFSDYYVFEINPDSGEYRLRLRSDGSWTSVMDAKVSPLVNTGAASTVLRVVARGSRCT